MGSLLAMDLRDYLSTGGITTVTAGRLPPFADRHVGILETGGLPPVHAMAASPGLAVMEYPRVQVLSRAETYPAAAQLAQNVDSLLCGLRARTLNATRYEWIEAVQSPFLLEEDDNGRVVMACNYQIAKHRSTSTST